VSGPPEFYRVTKTFHNGLQGMPVTLRPRDLELHLEVNRENAQRLMLEADVVLVHDPQPIYLPRFTPAGRVGRWIWRCHVDASKPARAVWSDFCAVAPSPELKERFKTELAQLRSGGARHQSACADEEQQLQATSQFHFFLFWLL